jgi:putative hydrolase of the HAD superfamily
MTKPPEIEAVLFDYGMVLSGPPDPAAWAKLRDLTGLSEDALHREYWRYRHDYDRGAFTGIAYWQQMAAATGKHFTPEQITALIAADIDLWSQPNPPMIAWAQALQRADVKTGILSNIGDAMAAGFLAKFEWLAAFTHCTWSYALKMAKPEATIYRCAADGLATPPERILFLDDREENIAAAAESGMQTIHYAGPDDAGQARSLEEMRTRGLTALLHPERT